MSDKQKDADANGKAGTRGCRIKSGDQKSDAGVASDKQKLVLIASGEDKKTVGLTSNADTQLRELIGSLQERQSESSQEEGLPPAA